MTEDGRGARYSDLFESAHNHGSDCAYCPICATIAVVRKTNPEVVEHLAAAARELVLAAGLFLETAGDAMGDQKTSRAGGEKKVRRIEVV